MRCCVESGVSSPLGVSSLDSAFPNDRAHILAKFIRFDVVAHVLASQRMIQNGLATNRYVPDRHRVFFDLSDAHEAMSLEVGRDHVSALEAKDGISPARSEEHTS